MKWLDKKKNEILRKWKNNEISLRDAVSELSDLGYANAWAILENT